MVQSLYQIDLITSAATARLLSHGDMIEGEIGFSTQQDVSKYGPIGSEWGETQSLKNAYVSLGWARREDHASHAAARAHCLRTAASAQLPTGTLRISILGGETWEIMDCSVASTNPMPLVGFGFRTVTAYAASGGRMVPGAAITLYAGIPWIFILQDWDALTGEWDDL